MKNFSGEVVVAAVLLILLALLLNPFGIFMPDYMAMSILAGLVVLFGIFANFIWRERSGDERERFHRMFADRAAFLTGSGTLLLGIVIQETRHALDPWLLIVFAAMLIAKVGGLIYSKVKL